MADIFEVKVDTNRDLEVIKHLGTFNKVVVCIHLKSGQIHFHPRADIVGGGWKMIVYRKEGKGPPKSMFERVLDDSQYERIIEGISENLADRLLGDLEED